MPGLVAPPEAAAPPEAVPAEAEVAHLLACQLGSWYPSLAAHALRSIVIDLPDQFVAFLAADGVFLKESSAAVSRCGCAWSPARARAVCGPPAH